jgi:long-chain-fatty-acid--[acyl-carrier-protein] ligase
MMIIPKIKMSDRAVLLFTSGSESLPKAVPLTHSNIIYDILGAISNFPIQEQDVLLGFLPPFHSFGFTINTIMPLITGHRLICFPDPNDAKTISNIISHCKATTITATPTFLKMIL